MSMLFKAAATLLALPIGLYAVSHRSLGELFGLTRAGADVAVKGAMGQVPTEVHDQKLDNDVELQRRQITDHQVALNLSQRELETLASQVQDLDERAARRRRLLGEAYPVLQAAMADSHSSVQFAGAEHTLAAFQANLDQLLAEEEREARQLGIRRAGLAKLTTSIGDGQRALSDMRDSLLALEQEIDLLRTRREQARLEGDTLELVSTVSGTGLPATGAIGAGAEQLRAEVGRLEAGNEARRAAVPASVTSNRVAADWERLERLKSIQSAAAAPTAEPVGEALTQDPSAMSPRNEVEGGAQGSSN